jgi:riboflavin kinase / FMN adenylyltransferase
VFPLPLITKLHRIALQRNSKWLCSERTPQRVVALGSFDGFHSGHKTLLERVASNASDLRSKGVDVESAILTFYPHPARALNKGFTDWPIQRIKQRLEIVSRYGINSLFCCRFDSELGETSAEDFCRLVLIDQLNVTNLVVGPDAGLGKNRTGDVAFLTAYLAQRGITLDVLPYYTENHGKVGSRQIRAFLAEGKIQEANGLLGDNPYKLFGRVIHGDKRGRLINFPTLNVRPGRQLTPKKGVYLGNVTLEGCSYPAVINIGTRPTFAGSELLCEAHVFSATHSMPPIVLGERYGERVQIGFEHFLRDEKRFSSVEELATQLSDDVRRARQLLAKTL